MPEPKGMYRGTFYGYPVKLSFRLTLMLCLNGHPRNISCMPVVKFRTCLDLERKS